MERGAISLQLVEDTAGPSLKVRNGDPRDPALPVAPEFVPIARQLAGGPPEPGASSASGRQPDDFSAAALAQLAQFTLGDVGALSRYVDYDALLPPGSPPVRPREVSVILTKLCNLRCLHCYNDSARRDPHELADHEKLELVDYLGRWGVTILNLTGGEPTIDPVFAEILAVAGRWRMGVKISTNAWHFPPALHDAIRSGTVIQLSISLDGADEDTHDWLRQRRGSFKRVLASLATLESCRPRTVVLNGGIHRGSLAHMDAMAEFAASQPVDVLAFKPVTFSGRPGAAPTFLLGPDELAQFAANRDRLRTRYAGRLVIDGKLTGDDVSPELQEDLHCQAAHTAMVVNANGRMLPCDTLAGVPDAPNVRDTTPAAAWLGHPVFSWFRQLRERSSGGCGTSGCPGNAASRQIAEQRRRGEVAPVFVPLQQVLQGA